MKIKIFLSYDYSILFKYCFQRVATYTCKSGKHFKIYSLDSYSHYGSCICIGLIIYPSNYAVQSNQPKWTIYVVT